MPGHGHGMHITVLVKGLNWAGWVATCMEHEHEWA